MTRLWTTAEANAELERLIKVVSSLRATVEHLRDEVVSVPARAGGNGHSGHHRDERDTMATVEQLAAEGIVVRDIERGLLDFAAESPSGRRYWLCWVVGEPEVAWWHWPDDGFAGRQPLTTPPE